MSWQNDGRTRPSKETLFARKLERDAEGRSAASDYERDQQATLARTAKLKALRLAQEVKVEPPKPKRKKK